MVLVDESVLADFRCRVHCEVCGRPALRGLDPMHIFSRGAGRVDHPWNLLAGHRACHTAQHQGQLSRADLLAIAAAREGLLQRHIEDLVYWVRRLPKGRLTLAEFRQQYPDLEREVLGTWTTNGGAR